MLFHKVIQVQEAQKADVPQAFSQLELAAKKKQNKKAAATKPWMVIWATALVIFFMGMSLIAHGQKFEALETVSLNLAVAVTSASLGAFLGERVAIKDLTVK